jgi:hypothetical protein
VSALTRRVEKAEAIIAPKSRIIVMEAGCDVPEAEVDAFVRDVLHARPMDLVVVIRNFCYRLCAPRHIRTDDCR